jgi:hypothetical protein
MRRDPARPRLEQLPAQLFLAQVEEPRLVTSALQLYVVDADAGSVGLRDLRDRRRLSPSRDGLVAVV